MSPYGKALLGLHSWGGMIFSWLLIPIFITGSIAVFEPQISHWMRPELIASHNTASASLDIAEARLRAVAADEPIWRIMLPGSRRPYIQIAWGQGGFRMQKREMLHAVSGEPMAARETSGGKFFTHFHADLLLGRPGRWIVGAAGIFMLAAIISGVLIHHRIFKEFFTLRPRSGKRRSWLDVHNLFGVATLPFMLMIAYTGVVILADTIMPAASNMLYEGNPRASRAELVKTFERKPSGTKAEALPLHTHLARAERILDDDDSVDSLLVRNPGDRKALVETAGNVTGRVTSIADRVVFDAVSGELFGRQTEWNPMLTSFRTLVGLHLAYFGGTAIQWLYFLSGLLGAIMMAIGTVLLLRKRRQRHDGDAMQRWLEAMGAASAGGTLLACLAYLWANRLIPAAMPSRSSLEITAFFSMWGLTLLHAVLRGRKAWREQLMAAAAFLILLAIFDALGGGFDDATRGNIDLSLLAFGALLMVCGKRFFRPEETP